MRILMLGNSFTFTNDMPQMLAELTGAEVVHHTRGGARLSEQLNPTTRLGSRTQAALVEKRWDYVVLQEMSHGPITAPKSFFSSVERLCGQIWVNGAAPVLFATWAYQKGGAKLAAKSWDYPCSVRSLSKSRPGKLCSVGRCGTAVLRSGRYPGSLRRRWRPPQRFGLPRRSGDHRSRDPTAQGGAVMTAETKSRRHLSRGTAGSGSHHRLHRPAAGVKELIISYSPFL